MVLCTARTLLSLPRVSRKKERALVLRCPLIRPNHVSFSCRSRGCAFTITDSMPASSSWLWTDRKVRCGKLGNGHPLNADKPGRYKRSHITQFRFRGLTDVDHKVSRPKCDSLCEQWHYGGWTRDLVSAQWLTFIPCSGNRVIRWWPIGAWFMNHPSFTGVVNMDSLLPNQDDRTGTTEC